MGFRTGAWAKIWEITPGERSTKLRVSTSKKNKQSGEYEQDFSGFITLAGTAHREAGHLKAGDRFQIGDCDVSSRYDKEKKKEYINFTVFSFHLSDDTQSKTGPLTTNTSPDTTTVEEPDEEELPF